MGIPTRQQGHLETAIRHAARRFATGVTVVAVRHDDGVHALTANSFVTLSLAPALVGVSIRPDGRMRGLLERAPRFGVSVLNETQAEYARHYASRGRVCDPNDVHPLTEDGPPLVLGCSAYFVCECDRVYPVGDHDLIVASVVRCGVGDADVAPLLFLDGRLQGGPR